MRVRRWHGLICTFRFKLQLGTAERRAVLDVMVSLAREGMTMIVVTHDDGLCTRGRLFSKILAH